MALHQQIVFPADLSHWERKNGAAGIAGVHKTGDVIRNIVRQQNRLNTKISQKRVRVAEMCEGQRLVGWHCLLEINESDPIFQLRRLRPKR